jgi:hypothetical protein
MARLARWWIEADFGLQLPEIDERIGLTTRSLSIMGGWDAMVEITDADTSALHRGHEQAKIAVAGTHHLVNVVGLLHHIDGKFGVQIPRYLATATCINKLLVGLVTTV